MAAATRSGTVFNVDYTMLFVYNSSRVSGGCWDIFYGYNSDTTDLEEALTPLTGTTETLTPTQVYDAIKSGKSVVLQHTHSFLGLFTFASFNIFEREKTVISTSIAKNGDTYLVGSLAGLTGSNEWVFNITEMAEADDIPVAVNEALAQAKASGEFDGADGLTPTIGENGNWYLGDTDTGKPSRGDKGADGKSAYQYAQDGGYAGTEEEFAEKLAAAIPSVDSTLAKSGQAADAAVVGNRLSSLSEEIGNADKPTDEQVSAAVNAYLDANPVSGGISTTAKNLLITILRSGVYSDNQSDNITALETALGGGTTEPEEPDVPVETTYAISNELINCTSSNSATSVKENAAYSTTLTANDGYTLTGGTVTVTMGGVDITATAYADGVISIAAVTGDVEIFASAVVVQAEAALPEDGLIAYFDFRTTTYDNAGSGGKTTIAPTKGSGQLYMWANNSISAQTEYGLKPANSRAWQYDQNGGTNATALGDAFTVIQLTYGEVPAFGFNYSNIPPLWAFRPQYINTSGSTTWAEKINGSNFNSDSKGDYNFTVVRADGATLTEIFDTSRTTYNGGDIDGFSRWIDTPAGNIASTGDTKYCTAMAIYNRALTDSEIEEAREFMKTLEVTA